MVFSPRQFPFLLYNFILLQNCTIHYHCLIFSVSLTLILLNYLTHAYTFSIVIKKTKNELIHCFSTVIAQNFEIKRQVSRSFSCAPVQRNNVDWQSWHEAPEARRNRKKRRSRTIMWFITEEIVRYYPIVCRVQLRVSETLAITRCAGEWLWSADTSFVRCRRWMWRVHLFFVE